MHMRVILHRRTGLIDFQRRAVRCRRVCVLTCARQQQRTGPSDLTATAPSSEIECQHSQACARHMESVCEWQIERIMHLRRGRIMRLRVILVCACGRAVHDIQLEQQQRDVGH